MSLVLQLRHAGRALRVETSRTPKDAGSECDIYAGVRQIHNNAPRSRITPRDAPAALSASCENEAVETVPTEQSEELSKLAFGSNHMLALMAEIARSSDGKFSTPSVSAATGLSTSTIHALLKRLKQLGLVRRTDEVTPDRVRIYQRAVHPTWDYALRLEAEADARAAGTFTIQWEAATAGR